MTRSNEPVDSRSGSGGCTKIRPFFSRRTFACRSISPASARIDTGSTLEAIRRRRCEPGVISTTAPVPRLSTYCGGWCAILRGSGRPTDSCGAPCCKGSCGSVCTDGYRLQSAGKGRHRLRVDRGEPARQACHRVVVELEGLPRAHARAITAASPAPKPRIVSDECGSSHRKHCRQSRSVERGERNVSLDNICRLAWALEVDVQELQKPGRS